MVPAKAFESVLRRHVLEAWFPRCLDLTHGGFLCDFDRTWSSVGPHDKLLEFQARQTLVAADACRLYPTDQQLRKAALHGFRYLREVMWDADAGGWFHLMNRAGRPLEAETKHAHGIAYAIEACASVYLTTGEPAALEHAREGFEWLDRYARDRENGGYFGFLKRDGTVIRTPSESPLPGEADTLGTEIGMKDANVHSDLVETFTELHRVWPDPKVAERLGEVIELVSERMVVAATGAMHMFVTADWQPLPHLARAGYQSQTAFRFLRARGLAGEQRKLERLARSLLDHVLRFMADPRGGYWYATAGTLPSVLQEQPLVVKRKDWWTEFEVLKALLAVGRLFPKQPDYLEKFEAQWDYLQRNLLDTRHGGWYTGGLDMSRRRRRVLGPRFAPASLTRKGDIWKDASHDGLSD